MELYTINKTDINVAIIGTANPENWTKSTFKKMIKQAIIFINDLNVRSITLISGAAAWSDHLVVYLYLKKDKLKLPINGLILHFPCLFNGKFLDNGEWSWKINPGKTANEYHSKFSKKIDRNSFKDIEKAIQKGAQVIVSDGFHSRNRKVAKAADYILAFGESDAPTGGTKYTYDLAKCFKEYIRLS